MNRKSLEKIVTELKKAAIQKIQKSYFFINEIPDDLELNEEDIIYLLKI